VIDKTLQKAAEKLSHESNQVEEFAKEYKAKTGQDIFQADSKTFKFWLVRYSEYKANKITFFEFVEVFYMDLILAGLLTPFLPRVRTV